MIQKIELFILVTIFILTVRNVLIEYIQPDGTFSSTNTIKRGLSIIKGMFKKE